MATSGSGSGSGPGPASKRVRVDDDADITTVASATLALATAPIPMAIATNPVASAAAATAPVPMATAARPAAVPAVPAVHQLKQVQYNCNLTLENIFADLPNVKYTRLQPGSEDYNKIVGPMNADPAFCSLAVYSIENELLIDHFKVEASHFAKKGNGNPNILLVYHCTSPEAIRSIVNGGFNIGLARFGYFGKGAYFTKSFRKANYYCQHKGNPNAIRVMLVCDIALGQTYNFEPGLLARDLVQPPQNKDSVSGFISGDREYVVYNPNQILPKYVVLYQYTNTEQETQPLSRIPPGCKDLTTFCLSEKLGDLFGRILVAANSETEPIINALIDGLRRRTIDATKFLKDTANILKIIYREENLDIKIMDELEKSDLILKYLSASTHSTNSGAGAAAASTAPASTVASMGSVVSGAGAASTASAAPVASTGSVVSRAGAGASAAAAASAPPTIGSSSANSSALVQRTSMDAAEALLLIGNSGAKLAADEVEDDDI